MMLLLKYSFYFVEPKLFPIFYVAIQYRAGAGARAGVRARAGAKIK